MKLYKVLILALVALCLFSSTFAQDTTTGDGTTGDSTTGDGTTTDSSTTGSTVTTTGGNTGFYVTVNITTNATVQVNSTDGNNNKIVNDTSGVKEALAQALNVSVEDITFDVGTPLPAIALVQVFYEDPAVIEEKTYIPNTETAKQLNALTTQLQAALLSTSAIFEALLADNNITAIPPWVVGGTYITRYNGTSNETTTGTSDTSGTSAASTVTSGTSGKGTTTSSASTISSSFILVVLGVISTVVTLVL